MKRFPLGQIHATPGVIEQFTPSFTLRALQRHAVGDWGDVSQSDRGLNEIALAAGERLVSVYIHPDTSERLWIITEADRSLTTLLLPEEY